MLFLESSQIDQLRKKIIKIFKETGFKIDIETDLKIVNFLDMTFNLINGSYKPYKKTKFKPPTTDNKETAKNNQRQIMQKFFKCRDFSCIKNRIWNSIEEQWV